MTCEVSVITPVYNESKTLNENVRRIKQALRHASHEIVIVDDNSPDGSGVIADQLSESDPNIKVLHRPRKLGLGTAYKEGFRLTTGLSIVSMDSDLSHDPSYIPSMIQALSDSDIVIGSRLVHSGRIVGRTLIRDLLSISVNTVIRLLLRVKIFDWTSGLRVYRREVWEEIMPDVHCDKWDFQFESLYKAVKRGYAVKEHPIAFYERAEGESKFSLGEGLVFMKSFIKIILNQK